MKRPIFAMSLAGLFLAAGCASAPQAGSSNQKDEGISEQVSASVEQADANSEGDEPSEADYVSMLDEREAFIADQQLDPTNSGPLKSVTPQQKAFIAFQREYLEIGGIPWQDEFEDFYLALVLNACEHSILNHHQVSLDSAQIYFDTSPILMAVNGGKSIPREQLTAIASYVAGGTTYLCEADSKQWLEFAHSLE